MGLFDKSSGGKGKKGSHTPVAEVEGMLRTGTPESVIRSRLKDEKYSTDEVNKALEQAKIKVSAGEVAPSDIKAPWEEVDQGSIPGQGGEMAPPWESEGAQPGAGGAGVPGQGPGVPGQGPGVPGPATPEPLASMPESPLVPGAPTPAPAPAAGAPGYSLDDLHSMIQPLLEGLRAEIDAKLDNISSNLEKVSSTEKKLDALIKDLEKIKTGYGEISDKTKDIGDYQDELNQLKTSVNSVLEILKGTLPPMIKTLREMKGGKAEADKVKKQIEHLI